jgi:hypothetical protein
LIGIAPVRRAPEHISAFFVFLARKTGATMRNKLLSGAAALAFVLGVTTATAQNNSQPQRGDDHAQSPRQSQTSQRSTPPGAQPGGQDERGAQLQSGPAPGNIQGQSQRETREPAPAQNQQDAQTPQQGAAQGGAQGQIRQGTRESAPRQSQQSAQAPQQGQSPQDDQTATRQSEQPDASGRIELGEQQQTRISSVIREQKLEPVTNLNFAVSVGSAVPPSVRLHPLPRELADVVPEYRSYNFFVAQREVVIVDPQSYKIVAFVPFSGGGSVGTASSRDSIGTAAPQASPPETRTTRTERKKVTTERQTVHKDIDRRPAERETDVTVGSSGPDSVEVEDVPPRARRMAPPVRRYRYFEPEDRGPEVAPPGPPPVFPFPLFDFFR